MKGQSFWKRLGFALHGIKVATIRERSFRTQLLFPFALIVLLLVIRPSAVWCAVMALTVGLVLVAELINSALETLIDHVHPGQHPEIGAAKDIAAGAVLVSSLVSLVVALIFVVDWLFTFSQ